MEGAIALGMISYGVQPVASGFPSTQTTMLDGGFGISSKNCLIASSLYRRLKCVNTKVVFGHLRMTFSRSDHIVCFVLMDCSLWDSWRKLHSVMTTGMPSFNH